MLGEQRGQRSKANKGKTAYTAIQDILVPRIIIDVDCDAAQGGDFGGEFIEAGVVLSVAAMEISYLAFGECNGSIIRGGCTVLARRLRTFCVCCSIG